jgi:hypothetical protein
MKNTIQPKAALIILVLVLFLQPLAAQTTGRAEIQGVVRDQN